MNILTKLKSIFLKPKEEIKSIEPEIAKPIIKGEVIGQCVFCGLPIGSEDRVKTINEQIIHKRCFKKAKTQILMGKKFEDIIQIKMEDNK